MALDWLPTYPERFRTTLRQGVVASVQNIVPIPNLPPPTELTWHPLYPDWLAPKKGLRPHLHQPYVRWEGPPVADLRWLGLYPAWIARRTFLTALQRFYQAPSPEILRIPITGQWRPIFPVYIWRKPPLNGGLTVWRVDPTIIIASATCIEWDEGDLGRSLLDDEGVGRSTMTCDLQPQVGCVQEDLGRSIMDEEAIC